MKQFFALLLLSNTPFAVALANPEPVVKCDYSVYRLEFMEPNPKKVIYKQLNDIYPASELELSPAGFDIVKFLTHYERTIVRAVGSHGGKGVTFSLTHTENGFIQLDYDGPGKIYNPTCTLADGTEIKPPEKVRRPRQFEYPICNRTKEVREAIEKKMGKNCDSINVENFGAVVTELDLSNQGITELKEGDFEGLGNSLFKGNSDFAALHIKSLNLSHNKLRNLPAGLFGRKSGGPLPEDPLPLVAAYIESLDLSHNELSSEPDFLVKVDNGAFVGVAQTRRLDLSHNQLETLTENPPDKWFLQHWITRISCETDLSYNRLSMLPKLIAFKQKELLFDKNRQICSANVLDLTGNRLTNQSIEALEKIDVDDHDVEVRFNENPLNRFSLRKVTAPHRSPSVSLGSAGHKFDLTSLESRLGPRPKFKKISIENCEGSIPSNFYTASNILLKGCTFSMPSGFGAENEIENLVINDSVIQEIGVDELINGMYFINYSEAFPRNGRWLGKMHLMGATTIRKSLVTKLIEEFHIAKKERESPIPGMGEGKFFGDFEVDPSVKVIP